MLGRTSVRDFDTNLEETTLIINVPFNAEDSILVLLFHFGYDLVFVRATVSFGWHGLSSFWIIDWCSSLFSSLEVADSVSKFVAATI